MALPFLIVHGAGAWVVLLIGFVAVVVGVIFLARSRFAAQHECHVARSLDREAVVRGTLGGGSIATLVVETASSSKAVLHRDREVWIDTPEGRVMLVGDASVVAGTRVTGRRNGAPKRTPAAMYDDPGVHAPRLRARSIATATLRELAPGDHVIASGALVSEPSTEPTGYRDNATAVSLHATEVPITIAARSPRSASVRPSWPALALVAGFASIVGYKGEAALGDSWRDRCFDLRHLDDHGPLHVELSNTHACVLAYAMPNQPNVLEQLSEQLDRTPITNDAELRQHVELARVAGGCKMSLARLSKLAQPDALLDEAQRCGNTKSQQLALLELGRFDEASRLGPLERRAAALYVLGGRWAEAAALAESNAHDAETDPAFESGARAPVARQWRCVAELMRWYGGDHGALARTQTLAPGDDSPCRAELVEMTPAADRDALLLVGASEARAMSARRALTSDELDALSIEQTLGGHATLRQGSVGTYLASGSSETPIFSLADAWATAVAPEPQPGSTVDGFAFYDLRIIPHVLDGEIAAAHADLERAIAIENQLDRDGDTIYAKRELGVLHALIDLYGSATTTAFEPLATDDSLEIELQNYLMPHIYLRHGKVLDHGHWLHGDADGLEAAANGDATKLVTELLSEYSSETQLDVLAVLPRITIGRAEVVRAMRWRATEERMIGYDFPWCSIAYAGERRTLFELGGDRDEAARWAAIYARYRKAVTDRKVLVALALWGNRF